MDLGQRNMKYSGSSFSPIILEPHNTSSRIAYIIRQSTIGSRHVLIAMDISKGLHCVIAMSGNPLAQRARCS
jgi:hypothetical protein